jgi:acyl carrier protein
VPDRPPGTPDRPPGTPDRPPGTPKTPGQEPLAELAGMLRDATGEDERWAAAITEATRLEADLRLESIEFAALGELIRERYGDEADLRAFLAELDLDQIIALTAGDLLAYLAQGCGTDSRAEGGT